MITKLRQNRGETLIETLSALAIVVMAMFLLSNMLLAASRQNIKSTSMTEGYQQDVAIIEGGEDFITNVNHDQKIEEVLGSEIIDKLMNSRNKVNGTVLIKEKETSLENPTQEPDLPAELAQFSINVVFSGSSDGKLTGYTPDDD